MKDKDLIKHFDKNIETYKGQIHHLENAMGVYLVGRRLGWKVLYLMHDKRTIRKFEKILNVKFREEFEEFGDLAHKSLAYKLLGKVTNFWKAVSGDVKVKVNGKERLVRDPNVE
jgi:hypothetical protein